MNPLAQFSSTYWREIAATSVLTAFFLFFWINGPLVHMLEMVSIEAHLTEYSRPVLVGEHGVEQLHLTKILDWEEEKSHDHGLLLQDRLRKPYGILTNHERHPELSPELAIQIQEHSELVKNQRERSSLLPSMNLYAGILEDTVSGDKRIYLESADLVNHIKGYAGEINVGIIINENGQIEEVRHISSKETQSYLQRIQNSGFYEQFEQIFLDKGQQEIDVVSGATLTTEAIAKTVEQLVEKASPEPLVNYASLNELNAFTLRAMQSMRWILDITVIFLLFLFGFQKRIKKSKKSVLLVSVISVVYIGLFLNNSFTYISFIHPFVGTSVSSLVGLYALFVLLGAIWGKNTYCKYVCPFGNVQRLILHFSPSGMRRKFFLPNKWINRVRNGLTIIIGTGVLLGIRSWSNFELFPDLFGYQFITLWTFVAIVVVLTTMVYPMLWCRLLCPTGSILDGVSNLMHIKKVRIKSLTPKKIKTAA